MIYVLINEDIKPALGRLFDIVVWNAAPAVEKRQNSTLALVIPNMPHVK